MKADKRISKRRDRRGLRIGNRVRRSSHGRPRLSVYRSNKHIYAQIIDDEAGKTLASAATLANEGGGSNKAAAALVGKTVAERAVEQGIKRVVFDRGHYKYHGRVAALATAAREAGLEF